MADAETTNDEAFISDSVFGTSGDPVNLRSQYQACSYNQLTFSPVADNTNFNGRQSDKGVITVTNNTFLVTGVSDSLVRNEMQSLVGAQIDGEYHMFCIPPGTSGSWIGYVSEIAIFTYTFKNPNLFILLIPHRHTSTTIFLFLTMCGAPTFLFKCMKLDTTLALPIPARLLPMTINPA